MIEGQRLETKFQVSEAIVGFDKQDMIAGFVVVEPEIAECFAVGDVAERGRRLNSSS